MTKMKNNQNQTKTGTNKIVDNSSYYRVTQKDVYP